VTSLERGLAEIWRPSFGNCINAEIVDQAQRMSAVWPGEDVRTPRVLASEPLSRFLYLRDRPRLAEEHATVRSQNAEVEVIASHRCELSSDLATGDVAAHR
jgi:hypothetical protein